MKWFLSKFLPILKHTDTLGESKGSIFHFYVIRQHIMSSCKKKSTGTIQAPSCVCNIKPLDIREKNIKPLETFTWLIICLHCSFLSTFSDSFLRYSKEYQPDTVMNINLHCPLLGMQTSCWEARPNLVLRYQSHISGLPLFWYKQIDDWVILYAQLLKNELGRQKQGANYSPTKHPRTMGELRWLNCFLIRWGP